MKRKLGLLLGLVVIAGCGGGGSSTQGSKVVGEQPPVVFKEEESKKVNETDKTRLPDEKKKIQTDQEPIKTPEEPKLSEFDSEPERILWVNRLAPSDDYLEVMLRRATFAYPPLGKAFLIVYVNDQGNIQRKMCPNNSEADRRTCSEEILFNLLAIRGKVKEETTPIDMGSFITEQISRKKKSEIIVITSAMPWSPEAVIEANWQVAEQSPYARVSILLMTSMTNEQPLANYKKWSQGMNGFFAYGYPVQQIGSGVIKWAADVWSGQASETTAITEEIKKEEPKIEEPKKEEAKTSQTPKTFPDVAEIRDAVKQATGMDMSFTRENSGPILSDVVSGDAYAAFLNDHPKYKGDSAIPVSQEGIQFFTVHPIFFYYKNGKWVSEWSKAKPGHMRMITQTGAQAFVDWMNSKLGQPKFDLEMKIGTDNHPQFFYDDGFRLRVKN